LTQQSYRRDRNWGDSYSRQVMDILKPLTPYCVDLSIAPVVEDNKHATDYVVTMAGGSIAVRVRRPWYEYRDLTIRSRRDNGQKTELAKIKEGHAFRYFYGWTTDKNTISEWMLVDLDKLRASGLLERNWNERPNKDKQGKSDGTWFIAIPFTVLEKAGCIIERQLKFAPMSLRQVNPFASSEEGIRRASNAKCYSPRVEQATLFEAMR
jgi:hypothetical protein